MLEVQTPIQKEKQTALFPSNRKRWTIVGLLFTITVINLIDRQTLSVLAPILRETFHLSNVQYGRIVSALQFGMMTGELPLGHLMDRFGARIGLSFAVMWWSAATAAQAAARSGGMFGFIRFWMGTGECGNFSGGVKTIGRLFSQRDRTLAIGIFNSGSVVGSTLAPPLIVYLLHRYGFHAAFLVPAALGLLWVPVWWFAYGREHKPEHVRRTKEVSARTMLHDPNTWALMLCRGFIGPVMQFYWYWTPSYLASVRHASMIDIGMIAWIPFLFGDIGGVFGGWSAGKLQRRGMSVPKMRKLLMFSSALVCLTSALVPMISQTGIAILVIGIAVGADNFLSANMFAAITDLFEDKKVGRASAFMGVASGLSGLLFPLITGRLVDKISYTPVFLIVGLMPLVGTMFLFLLGRRYKTMPHPHWSAH